MKMGCAAEIGGVAYAALRQARLTSLLGLLLLSGCAVGPDFSKPVLAKDAGYLSTGTAKLAGSGGQKIAYGADVPGRWWELFQNKHLDALMQRAIVHSPTLEAARAALTQANETALAERGSLFPQFTSSGSVERSKTASTGIYNLYSLQPEVSWSLDLFGGNRRSVEAVRAAAEAQAFEAEATYLTLTSDLAEGVIQEASYREQIRATNEIISALRELLGVLETQVDVGTASRANVLQQKATLAEAEASLPALEKERDQQQNAIAVLAGQFPNARSGAPFTLASLRLPHDLPLSVPASLVRQRPDVRNAEALMHQASAEIGVATANMLPDFTLSASLPTSASAIGDLFTTATSGWSLAAGITQPIFEGGTLLHKKRAAVAAYKEAAANYRAVVLDAFKDVADALRAIQHDGDALRAYVKAERAAKESLDLSRAIVKAGTGVYTDVLTAQQTYQNARIARVQAEAQRYLDAVALFEALGGGWWNRPDNLASRANPSRSTILTSGNKQ